MQLPIDNRVFHWGLALALSLGLGLGLACSPASNRPQNDGTGHSPSGDPGAGGDPGNNGDPEDGDSGTTQIGCVGGLCITDVVIVYDTGFGNQITLRGQGGGLTWDLGQQCIWEEVNQWRCRLQGDPGTYLLKPLHNDSTWARGANWKVQAGTETVIYPHFFESSGSILFHDDFQSTVLGNARRIAVYLPASYNENLAQSYPVVVMHDGQNLFFAAEATFGVEWQLDETLDALAETDPIEEVIVVAPYANDARVYEYTPTFDSFYDEGGGGEDYLDFIETEVLPFVHATYRTRHQTEPGRRPIIAGSSLGGLISLHACWMRPSTYRSCGVFSPSLHWNANNLMTLIQDDTGANPNIRIYLDSGDTGPSGDGYADTAAMAGILQDKGFVLDQNLEYVVGAGHEHNEAAWALRAPDALRFLLDDPGRAAP